MLSKFSSINKHVIISSECNLLHLAIRLLSPSTTSKFAFLLEFHSAHLMLSPGRSPTAPWLQPQSEPLWRPTRERRRGIPLLPLGFGPRPVFQSHKLSSSITVAIVLLSSRIFRGLEAMIVLSRIRESLTHSFLDTVRNLLPISSTKIPMNPSCVSSECYVS